MEQTALAGKRKGHGKQRSEKCTPEETEGMPVVDFHYGTQQDIVDPTNNEFSIF